ncbi:hypothetical protein COCOBI_13-3050 [Coccomyxa sp. Obi]|nr:hypothetical protein COCOBI_13-3050 [Coccomyxa sp. Obi]
MVVSRYAVASPSLTKAGVDSPQEVKLPSRHKAASQPNAGQSHLEFRPENDRAAQELPPLAKYKWPEPRFVEAPEPDRASSLRVLAEINEWAKKQPSDVFYCPCIPATKRP